MAPGSRQERKPHEAAEIHRAFRRRGCESSASRVRTSSFSISMSLGSESSAFHADDGITTCCACVRLRLLDDLKHRDQPAACGRQVCCGSRQSIPSSKYPSCAGVIVTVRYSPSRGAVDGHTKRPRSSRFANRHMPWPSCHSTLIREPRRPRKTNRWCGVGDKIALRTSIVDPKRVLWEL